MDTFLVEQEEAAAAHSTLGGWETTGMWPLLFSLAPLRERKKREVVEKKKHLEVIKINLLHILYILLIKIHLSQLGTGEQGH